MAEVRSGVLRRFSHEMATTRRKLVTFNEEDNQWEVSGDFGHPTDTNIYQEIIFECLERYFPGEVKKEWSVSAAATDAFMNRAIYAPRLDLAVGPFNTTLEEHLENHRRISLQGTIHPLMQKIMAAHSDLKLNQNPRCRLGIEISFSGSSKHILGDFTNASMMSLIGIVVSSEQNYIKVSRILNYIKLVRKLGKAPADLFGNCVVYKVDDFLNLIQASKQS
jgi:hypothetical protein